MANPLIKVLKNSTSSTPWSDEEAAGLTDIWAVDDNPGIVEKAFSGLPNGISDEDSNYFPKPLRVILFDDPDKFLDSLSQLSSDKLPQLFLVDMHFERSQKNGQDLINKIRETTNQSVCLGYSSDILFGATLDLPKDQANDHETIAKLIGADGWFFRNELIDEDFKLDSIGLSKKVEAAREKRLSQLTTRAINTGYISDTPNGEDAIGIDHDVEAFACLMASRHISPPLSIGLFGKWGMGKSFFLDRLQSAVNRLSKSHEETERKTFYKNITQIHFNAWHYVEADMWASLVTHIFESLVHEPISSDEVRKNRGKSIEYSSNGFSHKTKTSR